MSADSTGPRHVIGIGDFAVKQGRTGVIVTHALGSCLGITLYDSVAGVGGMLHAQLPLAARSPERAKEKPAIFVDLGIPLLLEAASRIGADRRRMRITVTGGANVIQTENDMFNIAKHNLTMMRKIFWQLDLRVAGEDTGGHRARTVRLDLATGATIVETAGQSSFI